MSSDLPPPDDATQPPDSNDRTHDNAALSPHAETGLSAPQTSPPAKRRGRWLWSILVVLLVAGGGFAGWYFGIYKGSEAPPAESKARTTPASDNDDSPRSRGDVPQGANAEADAAASDTVGNTLDASATTDSGGVTDAVAVSAKVSDAHLETASDAATDGPPADALPTTATADAQADRGAETQAGRIADTSAEVRAGASDAEVIGRGDGVASRRDTPSMDAGTDRIAAALGKDAATSERGDASRVSDTPSRDASAQAETAAVDDAAGRPSDTSKGVAKDAPKPPEASGSEPSADVADGATDNGPKDTAQGTPSDTSGKTEPDTAKDAIVNVMIVSIPSGATVNDGEEALGKTPLKVAVPRSKLPKTFVLWKRKKGMGVLKLKADVGEGASFTVRLERSR